MIRTSSSQYCCATIRSVCLVYSIYIDLHYNDNNYLTKGLGSKLTYRFGLLSIETVYKSGAGKQDSLRDNAIQTVLACGDYHPLPDQGLNAALFSARQIAPETTLRPVGFRRF